MMLIILITLGEFCASPALALADGYTLYLVSDRPKEVIKIYYIIYYLVHNLLCSIKRLENNILLFSLEEFVYLAVLDGD